MTSFFPDVNMWLALSVAGHTHKDVAWDWLRQTRPDALFLFSRYTHMGLLRLLTNPVVMGSQILDVRDAWSVYENWLTDSRIEFQSEPSGLHSHFRHALVPWDDSPASKWIGDCYLLAFAKGCGATLVTFDRPLAAFAKKHGYKALVPA